MPTQRDSCIRPKLSGYRTFVVSNVSSFGQLNDLLFPFVYIEFVFEAFGDIHLFASSRFDFTPPKHLSFDFSKGYTFTRSLPFNPVRDEL